MGNSYNLQTKSKIKINGIVFQQNAKMMIDDNVTEAVTKIERVLKSWSMRNFTTLGKILLVKTFGFSQVVYTLQSLVLEEEHYKKLNHVFYKFIWNRHFLAAKAPERVSRAIVTTPIANGGYGMLDLEKLDLGIKIKAMGKLMSSTHPFLIKIKDNSDLNNYFFPKSLLTCDRYTIAGLEALSSFRLNALKINQDNRTPDLIKSLRNIKLADIVSRAGRNSINYFTLRAGGKNIIKDLNEQELGSLGYFIDSDLMPRLRQCLRIRLDGIPVEMNQKVEIRNQLVDLRNISGNTIRANLAADAQIQVFKVGVTMTAKESKSWFNNLKKVLSTRHKNTLLRIMHAEVYTKQRLHRFGLTENPNCPRCGELEDLHHKILNCQYAQLIWKEVIKMSRKLSPTPGTRGTPGLPNPDRIEIKDILSVSNPFPTVLAVHAETFQRLLALKDDAQYLIRPIIFAKGIIRHLIMLERRSIIKDDLLSVLND